jgi:dTDP-4-amino-4,6-dideoxygalactose transaminase
VPVHLYGQPADLDGLSTFASRHRLAIVEDCCQAHLATFGGTPVGTRGVGGAFSFYPTKNLGAYGDGGMVVTADPELVKKLQLLRNYGQSQKYHHEVQGYNHRLDTLQAAALRVKLRYLDEWNEARRRHARRYSQGLAGTGVVVPPVMPDVEPVWHLYIIQTPARDALRDYLGERGISTGIHYPIPIHLQPAYAEMRLQRGDFPVSELAAEQMLSLPMYAELTDEQIDYVVEAIRDFVAERGARASAAAAD